MNEKELMLRCIYESNVAMNHYAYLVRKAGGRGSKAATFFSDCCAMVGGQDSLDSNSMYQAVATEFYLEKRKDLLKLLDIRQHYDGPDGIGGLVWKQFKCWYTDYRRHRQAQYVQAMEKYETNYDVLTYNHNSLEEKLMTEEQLNNIATYMATATNEEQFIYMCEIGLETRKMVASHTIGNFPGRDSISMQAYRVRRTKLFNKLRSL